MLKDEMKNKYSSFVTEISEILGLGKSIDILKLCATTDLFFDPLEERIAELEKENTELKEKVSYLEDNLRVARKDRENLQLKVGKGLKEFIKDCPYSALKFYANGYYAEQLTKAKEIIRKFSEFVNNKVEYDLEHPQEQTDLWNELCEKAEEFLNSEVEQ